MTSDVILPSAASGVLTSLRQWKRYPAYRDSGVDWLGVVPEHWNVWKVKHFANVTASNVDKHSFEGEKAVRLCNYVHVYYHDHITPDLDFMEATATAAEIARFKLKRGDVIVTKDSESWDDIAVPAYVQSQMDDVLCGYHLALIRPISIAADGRYLFRCFSARGINDQFRVAANGITRYGLGKDGLGSGWFPLPPLPEQRAVAAFLDRETAKIDALVAKRERLIELLQEKRAALVAHAVTKGLDSTVPMKDSGIEWLGEIPAHWDVRRLKFLTPQVTVGIVVTPAKYYVDEGIPCLRSLNVKEGHLSEDDLVFISDESNEELRKSKIFAGDLVAVRTGQPGTTAVVDSRFEGANCIDLIIIRKSSKFNSTFMAYVANSPMAKTQFGAGADGAIQQHFNIETAKSLLICLPPMGEQQDLVSFLDTEAGKIDTLIERVLQHIDKLREFRTALISAAVTGKIDVRNEVK